MVNIGDMTIQEEAVISPPAKAVFFSRDTSVASGTQAITGVGFTPSSISLHGSRGTGSSWGQLTPTFRGHTDGGANGTSGTYETVSGGNFIRIWISAGNYYTGVSATFDSDGFTITWTKSGSPTGTANFIATCFR